MIDELALSRGNSPQTLVETIEHQLKRPGLSVSTFLSFGNGISHSRGIIALIGSSPLPVPTLVDLRYVSQQGVPIIPVLYEGQIPGALPDDIVVQSWIDLTPGDHYDASLAELIERAYTLMGHSLQSRLTVEQALQQLAAAFPGIQWIRIMSLDGINHPLYRYEAVSGQPDTQVYREEDDRSKVTAAVRSYSSRISAMLGLQENRYSTMTGPHGTFFVMLMGDMESRWLMSFIVQGPVPVDAVVQYFEERDFLAHLVPLLGKAY